MERDNTESRSTEMGDVSDTSDATDTSDVNDMGDVNNMDDVSDMVDVNDMLDDAMAAMEVEAEEGESAPVTREFDAAQLESTFGMMFIWYVYEHVLILLYIFFRKTVYIY